MTVFNLPSQGVLYTSENHPLADGKIELRPMKAKDEQVLVANTPDVLDKLLNRCIVSEGVQAKDLYHQDKMFLLYMLRAISYGEDYSFVVKCPDCNEKNHHTINILNKDHMAVNSLEKLGPFTVEMSGAVITWDFITGEQESTIQRRLKNLKKVRREDEGAYIYNYAATIRTIDGDEPSPKTAIDFIKELSVKDLALLEDSMYEYRFGIVNDFILECESCFSESEVAIPLTETFFRPNRRVGRRQ